jgi:hypothetical protein
VRTAVQISRGGLPPAERPGPPGRPPARSGEPQPRSAATKSTAVEKLAWTFHDQLLANPDPLRPDMIVADMWRRIFRAALAEGRLLNYYLESDPELKLLERTTRSVLDYVRGRTVVSKTQIDSLLVNPETNVVKTGSSDSSVFVVNAELLEEGFFLRSVREGDGDPVTIVEFD